MALAFTKREHHSLGTLTGVIATATFGQKGRSQVESLANPFLDVKTKWSEANGFAEGVDSYVFTEAGSGGTLTQSSANLAVTGVNAQRYIFTYTVSAVTDVGGMTVTITTAFGDSAVTLTVSSAGTRSVEFLSDSSASTADFVISVATGTTSDSFILSNLNLVPVGYPTGGESVTASDLGLGQILFLNPIQGEDGFLYEWDAANNKILARQGPTSVGPIAEITAKTDVKAVVVELFAIGR